MKRNVLNFLLMGCMFFFVSCAGKTPVQKDSFLRIEKAIEGSIFVNPLEDATAGSVVGQVRLQEIYDRIVKKIKDNPKLSCAADKNQAAYVLDIRIYEFTAGNRALRFWVGFGAGSAKLHFVCKLKDAHGVVVDEQAFQRFGAASLRTGQEIEEQMKNLIIDYTCHWLRL